jgi:PAS domain S-box-containing protein
MSTPIDPVEPATPFEPRRIEERFRLLVESVQDYAIFILDPQGVVETWNPGARRLKGYEAQEIIGQHFSVFYTPESNARGWPEEELRRATEFGRVEDEGWRVRKDGSYFWASVVITALRDPSGGLQGFAKVTRDLTERRAHEEALRRSEEQMRLLIGSVSDYAIFMLDTEGHVLSWNTGAKTMKGYDEAEVLGKHFSMFFTAEDLLAGVPPRELEVARTAGRAETEGWRVRKGGGVFWANVVITPVLDTQGQLRGFAKVTRDLSDQRRLQDLEKSSRRMEEFIAMLAHELRNPLAPLRNAVQIMSMKGGLPPYMASLHEMIDRQVSQLTRLVDDLLDVARITTGNISLKREAMDLHDVVRSSVEVVREQIERKGQRLTLDLPAAPLTLLGDAARLTQALQNLLGNASRYTGNGGDIQVRVLREGRACLVSVSDSGIGLEPDAVDRIFNLFAQERVVRDPTDSGLGIGLSLARKVAQLHGGSLTAYSEGRGKGSTFTMLLPADAVDPVLESPGVPIHAPTTSRRVLVIDDNLDSTQSMVTMLGLLGHVVEGAFNGAQGIEMAENFRPDVVLLDLNMPGMDGFSVVKRLRAQHGTRLLIAAMTGYGRQGDRRSTLEKGFDDHLTKPVGIEQLRRLLSWQHQPGGTSR